MERRARTLKDFCDRTDTAGLLRDYSNPSTDGWARRTAVLSIEFKSRPSKKNTVERLATDAVHALNLLRRLNDSIDLLSFSEQIGAYSLDQVSHIGMYLDMFTDLWIVSATGSRIKKPRELQVPLCLKTVESTPYASMLRERRYAFSSDDTLRRFLVYDLVPAPIDNTNTMEGINIRNGQELAQRMPEAKLTHAVLGWVNETYPRVPRLRVS